MNRGIFLARLCSLLGSFLIGACAYAQQIDEKALAELRKRYESSFESIYVTDSVLNNLAVHLRANNIISRLTKQGTPAEVVSLFAKFLDDVSKDRVFLQLQLRSLRAGFKRQSDASPAIQQLPWSRSQVFQIAVLCDHYLQGQLQLVELRKKLANSEISITTSWNILDTFRRNPYVPAVTMTNPLQDFLAYLNKNPRKLNVLATEDPKIYANVANFKANAVAPTVLSPANVEIDWPGVVKSEWTAKYKVLESYAKSTDVTAVEPWARQLDHLQIIEYGKLIGSVPGPKIDWPGAKPPAQRLSPESGDEASGTR